MDGWCISTKLLLLTILLVLLVLAMLLVCTFVVIFVRTFANWGLCRRHCGAASHFLDLTLFTLLINRRRRRSKGLSFIYFWFIHKKPMYKFIIRKIGLATPPTHFHPFYVTKFVISSITLHEKIEIIIIANMRMIDMDMFICVTHTHIGLN